MTLTQGQSTTFVASGGVALEIQDDEGTVLATSVSSGADPMARIAGYSAPSTGIYYLRVLGAGSTVNYNLAMVKGASFDTQTGALNLAPTNVSAGGPYVIAQGGSVTLNASASNPEATDTLSYDWDLNGDGLYGDLTGASPTLTWAQLLAAGVNGDVGARMINVQVNDGQGNRVNSSSTSLNISDGAPRVMSVHVGSKTWAPAFVDHLTTHGLASSSGYLMPTGAAQTNALPWASLNQVSITFSENVNVTGNWFQIACNAHVARPQCCQPCSHGRILRQRCFENGKHAPREPGCALPALE